MYSLAENSFGYYVCYFSSLDDFPWLMNAYNPKLMILRETEHVFENTIKDIWSMFIYIPWGMNVLHFLWVAVVSLWLHQATQDSSSCRLSQSNHIFISNVLYKNINVQVMALL